MKEKEKRNSEKVKLTTLISDKIDFKIKKMPLEKRETLYNCKRINSSGRFNDYKTYVPNNRAPRYKKQQLTELKGEIGNSTMTAGGFNTPL